MTTRVAVGPDPTGMSHSPSKSFYLYGDPAAAVVARDEPLWHAWMKEHFPLTGGASNVA